MVSLLRHVYARMIPEISLGICVVWASCEQDEAAQEPQARQRRPASDYHTPLLAR